MSVTNSNLLGVYVLADSTSASALPVIDGQTDLPGAYDFSSVADGDVLYVYTEGGARKAVTMTVATGTATLSDLDLCGCATNSSMDISNTINEAICRDGSGGSTRHVAGGATSWSVSLDGLLNYSGTDATPADLVNIANENYYVIVKFDAGDVKYVGQALIESINIAGDVDGIATYSCSLTGQGLLYVHA